MLGTLLSDKYRVEEETKTARGGLHPTAWAAEGLHTTVGKKKGTHCYSETLHASEVK